MKTFKITVFILIIVFLIFNVILKKSFSFSKKHPLNNKGGNMKITTIFEHNGHIPSLYTCDGGDLAPELTISEVPKNAKELVLIVDDPDASMGTWVHWVLYNLPADTTIINAEKLPLEAKQGMTDVG